MNVFLGWIFISFWCFIPIDVFNFCLLRLLHVGFGFGCCLWRNWVLIFEKFCFDVCLVDLTWILQIGGFLFCFYFYLLILLMFGLCFVNSGVCMCCLSNFLLFCCFWATGESIVLWFSKCWGLCCFRNCGYALKKREFLGRWCGDV